MDEDAKQPTLRQAHRDYTRARIIDAAVESLKADAYEGLLVADVAERAGVAERTLYRYFPARIDLIRATWTHINAMFSETENPDTPELLISDPLTAFPAFDAEEALIRAIVTTRQGKELRLSIISERHAAIKNAVAAARPDLDESAQLRLSVVAQLLHSSVAWQHIKDYWSLDGKTAGIAVSEALQSLLTMPRRD